MPTSPELIQLQDAIGERFALERELGRGGMGSVWLARDLRLDRPVALKVLHTEIAAAPAARERFLHEARIAARLAHPHIVPVYGVEVVGEMVFLIMAMVEGETLGARVRQRGALSPSDAERMVREVGWALGYAHAHGVVHRDLTPENVLIERGTGRALLVDFGLAGATDAGEDGPTFGTPGYLSPEVIRGEAATAQGDIYALGAVAWLALSGTPPFTGGTTGELLAKHLVQPVPELPTGASGASRRLVAAVRACLAKDATDRPATSAELLALLDRAPEPVAIAPALQEWFTRWERVRPIYAIVTPIVGLQLWLLVEKYFNDGEAVLLLVAGITTLFATTILPALAHIGSELVALRRLAARGFGIADIRSAWHHWTVALRTQQARDGLPPLAGRVVFDLTVVGAVVIAIGLLVGLLVLPAFLDPVDLRWTRVVLMAYGSGVVLFTTAGLGIGFAAPGVRIAADGRIRRGIASLWHGRFGTLISRIAAWRQPPQMAASSTLHRHTELVLGLAIEELWQTLPHDTRATLGDVPGVAATLQRGAEELRTLAARVREARERLDERDRAEIDSLESTEHDLLLRHRETIGTLERLRVQLLRTAAGRPMSVELADEVAAARAAEREVLHGIAGVESVRGILGRAPRRSARSTPPTPTPVAA
jgi:serine/threonine-protein kinase